MRCSSFQNIFFVVVQYRLRSVNVHHFFTTLFDFDYLILLHEIVFLVRRAIWPPQVLYYEVNCSDSFAIKTLSVLVKFMDTLRSM